MPTPFPPAGSCGSSARPPRTGRWTTSSGWSASRRAARQLDARRRRRLAEDPRFRAARFCSTCEKSCLSGSVRTGPVSSAPLASRSPPRRRPSPAAVHGVHRPLRVPPDACRLLRPLRPRRRAAARIADTIVRKASAHLQIVDGHRVAGARRGGVLPRASRPEDTDIYGATERGYHSSSPFVSASRWPARDGDAGGIGIPVNCGHSEVGYIPADEVDERIWEHPRSSWRCCRCPRRPTRC